jgi:hypothetical protein
MANALYSKAKESFLSQNPSIDMDTDTINVAMVTSAYTYSAAHQFYSSLSGVVGTPATLASKTITSGVFDAADVTFSAVAGGSTVAALVIYKDTGNTATSPLIAYIDTASAGLPVTTNGGDIIISWDNGSSKIFSL